MNWLTLLSESEKRAAVAELAGLIASSDLIPKTLPFWEMAVERVLARHGFARLTVADSPVVDLVSCARTVADNMEGADFNAGGFYKKPNWMECNIIELRRAAAEVEKLYAARPLTAKTAAIGQIPDPNVPHGTNQPPVKCERCKGIGYWEIPETENKVTCPHCKGTGQI